MPNGLPAVHTGVGDLIGPEELAEVALLECVDRSQIAEPGKSYYRGLIEGTMETVHDGIVMLLGAS